MAAFKKLKPILKESNAEKMQQILTREFMSSEESDHEDVRCDDGTVRTKKKGFVVRELPWERTKLKKIKKLLDDEHLKTLSPHALSMIMPRVIGEPSQRSRPSCPVWAVRENELPQE